MHGGLRDLLKAGELSTHFSMFFLAIARIAQVSPLFLVSGEMAYLDTFNRRFQDEY
jgi:hypothetical protein